MADPNDIHIPEPPGHKRANIVFKGGMNLPIDEEPGELLEKLDRFMQDGKRWLILTDPTYGQQVALTQAAMGDIVLVGVTWLNRVAPKRSKQIVVPGDDDVVTLRRSH